MIVVANEATDDRSLLRSAGARRDLATAGAFSLAFVERPDRRQRLQFAYLVTAAASLAIVSSGRRHPSTVGRRSSADLLERLSDASVPAHDQATAGPRDVDVPRVALFGGSVGFSLLPHARRVDRGAGFAVAPSECQPRERNRRVTVATPNQRTCATTLPIASRSRRSPARSTWRSSSRASRSAPADDPRHRPRGDDRGRRSAPFISDQYVRIADRLAAEAGVDRVPLDDVSVHEHGDGLRHPVAALPRAGDRSASTA